MYLAMGKPLVFLDCSDGYHHPCQHLMNSITSVVINNRRCPLPTCNTELVTKCSIQVVGEMEYRFGVTRVKMREDGSAQ